MRLSSSTPCVVILTKKKVELKINEHYPIVKKEKTAGELNALPFVPHIFIIDVAAKSGIIFIFPWIKGAVI